MTWTVLSLGGSIVAPDQVDTTFLKKFKSMMQPLLRSQKFAIIVGGGKTARKYISAAKKIQPNLSKKQMDLIGIKATHLNAELVRQMFGSVASEVITKNPKQKLLNPKKKVVMGAGWDPGVSTDYNAVQLAIKLKAKAVLNLTNVDYVYDKNPKTFKNAKPQKELSWSQFKKIVGGTFSPGANMPFDPIAARLAQKHNIKVIIINGSKLANLKSCLQGKSFKGTVIYN